MTFNFFVWQVPALKSIELVGVKAFTVERLIMLVKLMERGSSRTSGVPRTKEHFQATKPTATVRNILKLT